MYHIWSHDDESLMHAMSLAKETSTSPSTESTELPCFEMLISSFTDHNPCANLCPSLLRLSQDATTGADEMHTFNLLADTDCSVHCGPRPFQGCCRSTSSAQALAREDSTMIPLVRAASLLVLVARSEVHPLYFCISPDMRSSYSRLVMLLLCRWHNSRHGPRARHVYSSLAEGRRSIARDLYT